MPVTSSNHTPTDIAISAWPACSRGGHQGRRPYILPGGFLGKLAQLALQTAHDALQDYGTLDLEAVKQRTAVSEGIS
jgi:hypothetical protein